MEEASWSRVTKDRQAQVCQILEVLHKWGIHTLGQLAGLDREQLRARLGPEAVRMWERANGQSDRPLKLVRPSEAFEESFEFENEIETAEPLLFMLRRFLEQLAVRLRGIYLVAKELTLRITFANKQQYKRCFKIPQPTNDVDVLFRMLQTHLENFKSEHPIIAVSLQAQPIKPNSQQFGLFETTLRNPNQLSETLACLTALLGVDRVGTPVLEETYRPDAFHIEPFSWQVGAIAINRPGATERLSDPALRRFRPASRASIFASKNLHLQSEKIRGKVVDQCGPYLISGNWWNETVWSLAEWDLELENGVFLRCHQSGETWKIDGVYD
jgi:protein ImuB